MILPEGHYKATHSKRERGRLERWIVGGGVLVTIVVVAVTIFSLTSHQPKNGHGCLSFNYTIVVGGEQFYECGAAARKTCARPPQEGGLGEPFMDALRRACIGAKFPYSTAS
jgi:hypothetical protein